MKVVACICFMLFVSVSFAQQAIVPQDVVQHGIGECQIIKVEESPYRDSTVTTEVYNLDGNILTSHEYSVWTDPPESGGHEFNKRRKFHYNDQGQLIRKTFPGDWFVKYYYQNERLFRSTRVDGGQVDEVSEYHYDEKGRLVKELRIDRWKGIYPELDSIFDPDGPYCADTLYYTYSKKAREMHLMHGCTSRENYIIREEFNNDQLNTRDIRTYDNPGYSGEITRYVYDKKGRLEYKRVFGWDHDLDDYNDRWRKQWHYIYFENNGLIKTIEYKGYGYDYTESYAYTFR